jgi:hypothetical protein
MGKSNLCKQPLRLPYARLDFLHTRSMVIVSIVIVFAAFFAWFVNFVGGGTRCWLLGIARFVWAHRVVSERLEEEQRAMTKFARKKKKENKEQHLPRSEVLFLESFKI